MPYRICKTFEIESGHVLSKHPDKCAKLAHYAHEHDLSLREANQALKFLSDEEFQKVVRPETMTKPDEA